MSLDFHAKLDEAARLADEYAKLDSPPPLEDYLASHEAVRDLLEPMLGGNSGTLPDPTPIDGDFDLAEPPPETIGPFKVLRKIGEGGFGVVYLAEQTAPLRRRVAVKILRRDRSTKQVLARFEIERQALARMAHANIARVHDAGLLEDGRPYFVMEYVPGVAITEYCDEHKVSIRDRLDLFLQVCDAIHHAHQRGILHRDIKPSNILVSLQDTKPVPKVIDFGVAKDYTGGRLAGETFYTRDGQVIGTPEYMSPEQARLTALDVDTRTDVYSLGVLLYELISGTLPFERDEMKKIAFDQMLRCIRETDPPKPSSRVSTSLDPHEASQIAVRRRLDRRTLVRKLSGDLDWIVMRALEKDRMRRYAAVSELAADVGRHLREEPVEAGPPTVAYRLTKFVRRNRLFVAAGLIVFAGLAISSGVLGVALLESKASVRHLIEARKEAERALLRAEYISEEVDGLFENIDIMGEKAGGNLRISDAIRLATAGIENRHDGSDPELNSYVLDHYGFALFNLDHLERAKQLLKMALDMRTAHYGEFNPLTLQTRSRYYMAVGERSDVESVVGNAIDQTRHVVELLESRFPEEHELIVNSLLNYGTSVETGAKRMSDETKDGALYDAEVIFRKAVGASTRFFGDEHPLTFRAKKNLGNCLRYRNRLEEGRDILTEVLTAEARHYQSARHPRRLVTMCHLGAIELALGNHDEAAAWYGKCVELSAATLGPDHSQTFLRRGNQIKCRLAAGQVERAYEELEEAHAAALRTLGEEAQATCALAKYLADAAYERGLAFKDAGRGADAVEMLVRARGLAEQSTKQVKRARVASLLSDIEKALDEIRNKG